MAIAAARRRADGDENGFGIANACSLDRELQPALGDVGRDQIGQARLEDRHLAALERRDPRRILVDAGHVMAEIGKAGAGNEPDISGANHGHAHDDSPLRLRPDQAHPPAPT